MDITFLRAPKYEGQVKAKPVSGKRGYSKIYFDLVLILEGRDSRFLACWPVGAVENKIY